MLIKTLVEKMNNKNQVVSLSKLIETKQYLSFVEKKALVERIIDNCIAIKDGFVQINEIDQYIQFTIETIKAYTNIEFSESPIEDYDLLCSSGLLGDVIDTFNGEYKMIMNLVEMQKKYVLEQNRIEFQIAKIANALTNAINEFGTTLSAKVNDFDKLLTPENIEMAKEFMNNFK